MTTVISGSVSISSLPSITVGSLPAVVSNGTQKTQVTDSSGNAVAVTDSKLRVMSTPYGYGIAEGVITGHTKWRTTGFRTALSTTESHLAIGATGRFPWPSVAQKVYIVSSSGNDTAAGTGARTITFAGIDAAGNVATETVTLNGATVVETVGTYLAPCIDDTYVATAGTGGVNAGTITCGTANPPAAATTWWAMSVGMNQASGSVFYVPTGKTLYISKVRVGESSTQGVVFRLHAKTPSGLWRRKELYLVSGEPDLDEFQMPPSYVAGSMLEITGTSNSGTAICSAKMLGWLE